MGTLILHTINVMATMIAVSVESENLRMTTLMKPTVTNFPVQHKLQLQPAPPVILQLVNFYFIKIIVDWCLSNDCDEQTENCVSTPTGFQCECKPGYSGIPCVGPVFKYKV